MLNSVLRHNMEQNIKTYSAKPRLKSIMEYDVEAMPNQKISSVQTGIYRLTSTVLPNVWKKSIIFGSIIVLLLVIITTAIFITMGKKSNSQGKIDCLKPTAYKILLVSIRL